MRRETIDGKEIVEVLGVPIEDLKKAYDEAVEYAKIFWANNAVRFPGEYQQTSFIVELVISSGKVGYNVGSEYEIYHRTEWRGGVVCSTILDVHPEFINALDLIMHEFGEVDESAYTSQEVTAYLKDVQSKFVVEHPLTFRSFEEIIEKFLGIEEYFD